MKEIYCPLCREKKKIAYCTARDNQNPVNEFTVVKCNSCSFLYLNPAPEKKELAKYYPEYYWIGEKKRVIEKIFPFLFSPSQEKARYLTKYKKAGKLLDVGCAEGFFLNHMKKQGWDATGIDFSEQAISYGKQNLGLDLYTGEVTKLEKEMKKKFDAITFWATLEHVYDPVETLQAARLLLKDDGILLFAVPNMESIQTKIFGKYWLHLDVPRHLCFFTPKTVKLLCEKTGFVIKDISYQSREHNPGGWIYSFLYYLRDRKNENDRNLYKKKSEDNEKIMNDKVLVDKKGQRNLSRAKKVFYWSIDNILILLILPFTYIEGFLKKGGTITVIAEKKKV